MALLTPGATRGETGAGNRVSIPAGTGRVELDLVVAGDEYVGYRVIILRDDGTEVWRSADLMTFGKEGRKILGAVVPATILQSGDYQVKVSGKVSDGTFEDLPSYRFRVVR